MSKHTKGSLSVVTLSDEAIGVGVQLPTGTYKMIAGAIPARPVAQNVVDMQRIATAWNCHDLLLEALQAVIDTPDHPMRNKCKDIARAAIARATPPGSGEGEGEVRT